MMVETILESSQDFAGMSNGSLPQWKRELLQRRLARARPSAAPPAPPPPPPPPPPPAADDDEELRYGPGIVKRLKSRYLSLALRDAPRRRPSVLRRAASLEHLLDERPPPAPRPARAPRPASLCAAPAPAPLARAAAPGPRRDCVKRARSVDALSRLEPRDEPAPPSPEPPPRPSARPPRRPRPLLREAERPPPDVVRETLRKFEAAPTRRPVPAARPLVAPRRSPTPDRAPDERPPPSPPSSPPPPPPPESPPPIATIAPEPIPDPPRSPSPVAEPEPVAAPRSPTRTIAPVEPAPKAPSPPPSSDEVEGSSGSRAALEELARVRYAPGVVPLSATNPVLAARAHRRVGVIRPMPASPAAAPASPPPPRLVNGHSTPEPSSLSRIGAAGIERAWSGSGGARPAWLRGAGPARARAAPPAATSVVFNFSDRKEVPDYIENDGIILRANRRIKFKAGEPGVVELRPGALCVDTEDAEGEGEGEAGPPSPCDVRFVNDNVLINGKSSMPNKPNRDRIAKLKLQFDDSLTRTFEYPSETSLCEEQPSSCPSPPAPAGPQTDNCASLADNTHIASAALSRYTPSKSCAVAFQLGLASPHPAAPDPAPRVPCVAAGAEEEGAEADARPCGADAARSWSDARAHHTDLLF